jgi:hypothetical protein
MPKKIIIVALVFLSLACTSEKSQEEITQDSLRHEEAAAKVKIMLDSLKSLPPRLSLIETIRQNESVTEAVITKGKVLAVAVLDNGMDKRPMAQLYCNMAKEHGQQINMVKILDARDAEFNVGPEGSPYGTVLAKVFCN